MTEHIFDELPSLLSGQSTQAELMSAAAHLRGCTDCQQELINALVAHASLSSAARYTPGVMPTVLTHVSQSGSLLDADLIGESSNVSDETAADSKDDSTGDSGDGSEDGSKASPARLPDLSALFAAVREEANQAAEVQDSRGFEADEDSDTTDTITDIDTRATKRRRFSGRWLVAAAVIGLGVGSAGVLAAKDAHTTANSTTVALAAYDTGSEPATAKVIGGDDMKLDASALPSPGGGALYEVWLTNAARTKMHALGWIGPDGKGEFTVPPELMGEYTAIEVSVQKINSSYDYSGTSVLRGTY
ncbi:anti-sigma-K factor rskA [Jatrophihabitans sp. GAS493]|uniref:anti-sigma factor n=1 Tax=Jatrophihabitans sp. GAS493 TaxID=1907575 RepID=UPI000BB7576B|nr:anti-sigma factor [Jatrophihabitans sp. GAS493]SOD73954.1 anti-sigma-K factor rskA [Jatrophihabitans sp. GAS493]